MTSAQTLPCQLVLSMTFKLFGRAIAVALITQQIAVAAPRVTSRVAGTMPSGETIHEYTLTNSSGLEAKVLTYGATLTRVRTPDRDGKLDSITLHLDTADDYLRGHPLLGSVVGRFANRIAGARFTLDGEEHRVTANAGKNHIHGGREGFHKVLWRAKPLKDESGVGVELEHVSPAGHEGYPGRLEVRVTYRLTENNELRMEYRAVTDAPTVINLTNHAYWNLAGAGSGDVLGHQLQLAAGFYVASDAHRYPTGEILSVASTPLDFRKPKAIGAEVANAAGGNYDHCFVIEREPGTRELALAARVVEDKSGRTMDVYTTQPGVQLYTPKGMRQQGASGKEYGSFGGFCLETQHFPDGPNHGHFPSTTLRPGEIYRETTVHKFGVTAAEDDAPGRQ